MDKKNRQLKGKPLKANALRPQQIRAIKVYPFQSALACLIWILGSFNALAYIC